MNADADARALEILEGAARQAGSPLDNAIRRIAARMRAELEQQGQPAPCTCHDHADAVCSEHGTKPAEQQGQAVATASCVHSWRGFGKASTVCCKSCGARAVTGYEDRPFTGPAQPVAGDAVRLAAEHLVRIGNREPEGELDRRIANLRAALSAAPAGQSMDPPIDQQRDMLARAIRDAAVKAGIASADAPMTGPMLLMLCDDLAEAAIVLPLGTRAEWQDNLGRWWPVTITDYHCATHSAQLDDGTFAIKYPTGRFRKLAAAPQPTANPGALSGKYSDVLVPFVAMMDAELHANAGKGDRPGWLAMDRKTALLEIYYHVAKLQKAARDDEPARIREYAADVANMAMMLADVCGVLPAAEREVRRG